MTTKAHNKLLPICTENKTRIYCALLDAGLQIKGWNLLSEMGFYGPRLADCEIEISKEKLKKEHPVFLRLGRHNNIPTFDYQRGWVGIFIPPTEGIGRWERFNVPEDQENLVLGDFLPEEYEGNVAVLRRYRNVLTSDIGCEDTLTFYEV